MDKESKRTTEYTVTLGPWRLRADSTVNLDNSYAPKPNTKIGDCGNGPLCAGERQVFARQESDRWRAVYCVIATLDVGDTVVVAVIGTVGVVSVVHFHSGAHYSALR